jgi:hypothetical protein
MAQHQWRPTSWCNKMRSYFEPNFLPTTWTDPSVLYVNEIAISLINRLKDWYTFISPIELIDNYERIIQPYDPSRPIEDLFEQMED